MRQNIAGLFTFQKNLSKQSGHREIAVVSRVFAVLKSETYKLQINEILQIQGYTRKGAYNSNPTYEHKKRLIN